LTFGSIDRLLVERIVHPMTPRELAAAAELKRAADVAANAPRQDDPAKTPSDDVVDAARRASKAAERGDRRAAQDALEDMRKASRALDAEERDQARSLRSIRDEIEGASSRGREGSERPSTTAHEALARMKKELDSPTKDPEGMRKLAERLERA